MQWIYGRNTVKEAIRQHKTQEVVIQSHSRNDDVIALCNKNRIKYRMMERRQIDNLVGKVVHQGVIASVSDYDYTPLNDILKGIPEGKQPCLLMLDGLEDPHNLGAILRTCDAIGVDGVIIGKKRSVGLNATVAKVSTGAIDHVPVAQVTNLTRTLDDLKKKGFWVVGCEADHASDYRSVDYNMPIVLVIGSEGFGISRLVKEHCDIQVFLPMVGHVNSLNASVAAAVLLYQVYESRHPFSR
ncbi:MAG: 23S rRNA (guanosine(2251)-2'-O)-methyltransferase RlmB [Erysipelotrichaceae bacterium]|nr:23S rRNA (guanosine(2251)-2'-O)-methyltransferase RlmB [Erysipelotrichaceae bacterium]